MNVFVTGGAGFIGSCLCRHLVGLGWRVTVFDKLTYAGHLSSLASIQDHPGFTFVRGDICDRDAVTAAFIDAKPQAVMHLAAESHVDRSILAAGDFIQTNIVGTTVLLEVARAWRDALPAPERDAFRFLHVSTDEIYGSLGSSGSFTETSPADPRSPYSASKAAADHLVSAWMHTYGLPAVISNCSNNYGPYQQREKLIPLTICNALDGKPLPVYGDGLNVRDWLHVDDHVRALVAVLTHGRIGERYNIGACNEHANLRIVERICDLVDRHAGNADRRRLITFVADRAGHDRRYAIDPTKIEHELGWRPQQDFAEGLDTTVCWYLQNRAWAQV
jgi:dTDP-glucose 4,6-dehydratase